MPAWYVDKVSVRLQMPAKGNVMLWSYYLLYTLYVNVNVIISLTSRNLPSGLYCE